MGRAGFVLAGGQSTRMGTDKALLPYRGTTLIEHVTAGVRRAAGSVAIVGPPEIYRRLNLPVVRDRFPGSGPLAGIHAALVESASDWNLVLACDMPAVPPAFLEELFLRAEGGAADCVVPLSDGNRPQPLCAVYHRRCAASAQESLAAGRKKLTSWLDRLAVDWKPTPESHWFLNANTPGEWEAHLRRESWRKPEIA